MYVVTPFSHIHRNIIMRRSRYTCTWLASRLKFMLVFVCLCSIRKLLPISWKLIYRIVQSYTVQGHIYYHVCVYMKSCYRTSIPYQYNFTMMFLQRIMYLRVYSSPFYPCIIGSTDPTAKETKASLARKANAIRKQVLEELRTGQLSGKPLASAAGENSANSEKFRRIITEIFTILLKEWRYLSIIIIVFFWHPI